MSCLKLIILWVIMVFNSYSQVNDLQTENNEEQYLKTYIKFGFGKLNDYLNFGGGVFFPVSEKFMAGIRGNVNSEINIFKTPTENLFDINISARYIPIMWNNFVAMAGCGVGYAGGDKRGALKSRPLLIAEEYEKIKFNSVSALAEMEVGYFLTKFLGISITGYSVITTKKNITTYQVSLFLYGLSNP